MSFKDHFSGHAGAYGKARPRYPAALFAFLAREAPARALAWDCGTGNGQAAAGLAAHFDRVVATDASAAQVAQAPSIPNVGFAVALAEAAPLAARSVDLVLVAQALHWFDPARFHAEVRRVARQGALVAASLYVRSHVADAIDAAVTRFYEDTVGPYWPDDRRHVDASYATLPFPYERVDAPPFALEVRWTADRFLAYLATWSAVQRYRAARGDDPVAGFAPGLRALWGEGERPVRWPLVLLLGRA